MKVTGVAAVKKWQRLPVGRNFPYFTLLFYSKHLTSDI